jgi:pimeloyl-ACP methyl ester carboxylesterase
MPESCFNRSMGHVARKAALGAGTALGAGLTGAAAWTLYSKYFISHQVSLPDAIDAERRDIPGPSGRLSYYADETAGELPLVLLHSINAAASAYEMRPLFEYYRGWRDVYAPDLPGFGFSARADTAYSPELYSSAIVQFLDSVVRRPADVVALSLTSEFAARAALARPDLFRSLALISPTGFSSRQSGGGSERWRRNLSFPLWSQALYDLLTTRPSIRYFLGKSFAGKVAGGLADYGYATSHQPGARFAPLYFLSGRLFSPQIAEDVYARLRTPVLVVYDRDGYIDFARLPGFLRTQEHWSAARIRPTRGLPHFEKLENTARRLEGFWQTAQPASLTAD